MAAFDVPTDRLSELHDADLRELVARLCEAERERNGGHRTEVRWGGAQTAPDGGLDVMVQVSGDFDPTPVIPRRIIGIQVKKSDLGPTPIKTEMCPSGTLRESILEIARQSGAYLIVSVGVDCAKKRLDVRRNAMRLAIGPYPEASALHTDFIDRHALARWVSAHPSVSLWLRDRLGLPRLNGWVGYSRWSSTPEGVDDTLIIQRGLRFRLPNSEVFEAVPNGIEAIRTLVRDSKKAIRIAGLSGIGKTRLAQALFEETDLGEPLPRTWAVYTDVGKDPDPLPLSMLETLIAERSPAVLIIDNCPPETHRVLAEKLAKSDGKVRLITIEYDVRDDRPEETEVVRIEAESPEIVEVLIRRRHPNRSSEDAHRLADLAGGNARLALALAAAAPETGSLSSFGEEALFGRLFWQRGQLNPHFEQSAEALSLVYSFDVEGLEQPDELKFLSGLTGIPRLTLHRHATMLVDRGLAQVRGRWRAVLPHALANRLADRAIRGLPWRDIAIAFGRPETARLRRSFGRRLAYLHDLQEARQIVLHWMQVGGPLDASQGAALYDLNLLERVCHLVPAEALDHLQNLAERFSAEDIVSQKIEQITRLLARLAFDPDYFDSAVRGLTELAVSIEDSEADNAGRAIESLFGLHLSGTLAQTVQRVAAARLAIYSQNPKVAKCGLTMLRTALKTSMWSSSIVSTDDARPNAFGWKPSGPEVVEWFRDWMALGEAAALAAPGAMGKKAKDILAKGISDIWRWVPPLRGDIEATAARLSEREPWVEGWNALRSMRSLDARREKDHDDIEVGRLSALISSLEPMDLLDRTRALLRSEGYFSEEPEGDGERDYESALHLHSAKLRGIGKELAERRDVLDALGSELFEALHNNPLEIGFGIGSASADPIGQWRQLRDIYLSVPALTRSPVVLSGFLAALDERFPDAAIDIRNECLDHPSLRRTYGAFAPAGHISEIELDRLTKAASDAEVRAAQFGRLIWADRHGLTDAQRVRLLSAMQHGQNGPEAVINAMGMLIHSEEEALRDWPPELRDIGISAVVTALTREKDNLNSMLDLYAARVVKKCLLFRDEVGARRLIDALVAHAERRYGSLYDVEKTAGVLAERAPMIFLDRTLASSDRRFRLRRGATFGRSPLASVEPQTLIDWCRMGGQERWIAVAEVIHPFGHDDGHDGETKVTSLSEQALSLVDSAPDAEAVVAVLAAHVQPSGWSGSLADIMERRLAALEQVSNSPVEGVRQAFDRHAAVLRREIARERDRERKEDHERDLSFE